MHAIWISCVAVLLRAFTAIPVNAVENLYVFPIATGGFALLIVPIFVARNQLRVAPLPVLDSARATWLSLFLAADVGGNQLLAAPASFAAGQLEAAAGERRVPPAALASLVSRRTPLRRLFDRAVVTEILDDPADTFLLGPVLVEVPLGPLRITPFEAMMAVRKTGMSWTKELRPTPHEVPKVIPGAPLQMSKAQIVKSLLDETECLKIGALVLAARQAIE